MLFRRHEAKAAPHTLGGSPAETRQRHRALIESATIEVVPLKNLDDARTHLHHGASVSVTCSPVKGIAETQRLSEELLSDGYDVIPHIAARLVRDRGHTRELAGWFRATGIAKMFLVAGDADQAGSYRDAPTFLADLLDTDHGLTALGVTAYPDHHPFISDDDLHAALHRKQELLADAALAGWCSSQMCFDPGQIESWLRRERADGLTLPLHLGVAGVIDKARLVSMGMRLGLGPSLSYLKKNRTAVAKMMRSTSYDPNDLIEPLARVSVELDIEALHVFTFNQIEATETWRQNVLGTS